MKDGMLMGLLVGLGIGALLFKHSPVAKEIVNKAEEAVKEEINNCAKEVVNKTK
ncbi:MAG: hypothetical protein ACOX6H_01165 [Christensenellales bacterium]